MRYRSLLLLTLLVCGVVSAVAQSKQPILGRWDLVVQGGNGPYTSWLEVTQGADGQLTGRFVGRFGSVRPIKQISFEGQNLTFRLPPQFELRKDDLVFNGKLAGKTLTGTTVSEDGKTLNWTGVPAPALKPSANPNWGTPIQLFNGKDLAGWKLRNERAAGCWTVDDGAMTNSKGCVDIITEQKFMDFKLRLDVKLAERAVNGGNPSNSGIYLRGRYEVQILDDFGKPAESHGMGSVYGFLTPSTSASKKAGEWQTYEITLLGRQLTVTLNGQTIIDKQEIPGITGGAIDSAEGTPGPIMLQGDHGKIWFRNVVLTPAK